VNDSQPEEYWEPLPADDGAQEFADPELAKGLLNQVRYLSGVLSALYDGELKARYDMGAWISEKARSLADAANSLAQSESLVTPPVQNLKNWVSPTGRPWITRSRTCPFCGSQSLILNGDDGQRVDAYCDNGECDAREFIVLVTRDGHEGRAHLRSDILAVKPRHTD
jgi:hypothetical protein